MPYFLIEGSYTPEGWAALTRRPEDREKTFKGLVERAGGKRRRLFRRAMDQTNRDPGRRRVRLRHAEPLVGSVKDRHLVAAKRQRDGERAGAAAGVQHPRRRSGSRASSRSRTRSSRIRPCVSSR